MKSDNIILINDAINSDVHWMPLKVFRLTTCVATVAVYCFMPPSRRTKRTKRFVINIIIIMIIIVIIIVVVVVFIFWWNLNGKSSILSLLSKYTILIGDEEPDGRIGVGKEIHVKREKGGPIRVRFRADGFLRSVAGAWPAVSLRLRQTDRRWH